jgi:ketosteroid isomerase-like protein
MDHLWLDAVPSEILGAMSQNVELLDRSYDALNRRDLDAYLALIDPEAEFTPRISQLEGGSVYRGHDGVREWWLTLFAVFPDFSS